MNLPNLLNKILTVTLLVSPAGIYSSLAYGIAINSGGWSGNGGDMHRGSDNPWFLGQEPVGYCIERSQEFPFSEEELRSMVREAFGMWKSFFIKYDMHSLTLPPVFPGNHRPGLSFPDGQTRSMSLNFQLTDCRLTDTDHLESNRLYFQFGISTPLIEQYKQLNEESALGVALRPAFRHDTYRNSGIIWLSNFTNERARLLHLILHETGHIFGMPHDSVFVMSQDVAYMLTDKQQFTDEFFGRIESFFWPYKLRVGDQVILTSRKGFRGPSPGAGIHHGTHPQITCSDKNFRPNINLPGEILRFLRLPPSGCHKISLEKISDGLSPVPDKKAFYNLVIESDHGKQWIMRAIFTSHFSPAGGRNKFKGPTLFTGWTINGDTGNKKFWHALPLDLSANWWHSSGYIDVNHGKTFAAKLNFEAGPYLEIYLPGSKTWWLLKSLPDFEKPHHPVPDHEPDSRQDPAFFPRSVSL